VMRCAGASRVCAWQLSRAILAEVGLHSSDDPSSSVSARRLDDGHWGVDAMGWSQGGALRPRWAPRAVAVDCRAWATGVPGPSVV
jgi:hypothetical protein